MATLAAATLLVALVVAPAVAAGAARRAATGREGGATLIGVEEPVLAGIRVGFLDVATFHCKGRSP